MLNIKGLRKVLAGQGIASKIRKILKHKGLHTSIKTQNEKLFEIPIQKQAVHRDRGRGTEPCLGVRDTYDMFLYEYSTDIQGT